MAKCESLPGRVDFPLGSNICSQCASVMLRFQSYPRHGIGLAIFTAWWLTYPSEKWWTSSVGVMKFPIYGKIIQMFQTTNQFMFKIPSEKEIFLGSGFVLGPLLGWPHYVTLMGLLATKQAAQVLTTGIPSGSGTVGYGSYGPLTIYQLQMLMFIDVP